jgi:hypothetical protein
VSGINFFFADDGHNIVAIGASEVVLSTASTSKRTTIRLVRTYNQWIIVRFLATVAHPSYLEEVALLII